MKNKLTILALILIALLIFGCEDNQVTQTVTDLNRCEMVFSVTYQNNNDTISENYKIVRLNISDNILYTEDYDEVRIAYRLEKIINLNLNLNNE